MLAVALGGIGVIVPGLPTTVFFIIAAWAFSKSSPRLEAWVLGLPRIGPMVHDHRSGLGMPRRAKFLAAAMIVLFAGGSAWLVDSGVLRSAILAAGAIGITYITLRVPSKERVLAERAA
uniref:Uncharacterized protein conserved in bacteria n=2 Tax=Bacteria TaxID=2 RepID=E0XSC1_9ACTN|nr:uncharacterized protein conserved in bacteria [uncultured actinobacterium HF0070_17F14]ADI17400.1 uncharacterized protein conserved in bacteria [uncultured Verrucomicrobiales bacterium HF0070_30L02]